jgi:hypothetical protein
MHCIHFLSSIKQNSILNYSFFKCSFNGTGYTIVINQGEADQERDLRRWPMKKTTLSPSKRRSMLVLGPTRAWSSTRPKSSCQEVKICLDVLSTLIPSALYLELKHIILSLGPNLRLSRFCFLAMLNS